ncbi:hypothetical protein AVEN_157098-1 [Araneus ventricosus]|uniref:Uncharacterized protein n=1 Tax=Araneus ventricosus TaxID=182803 RepID=A0A4Y2FTL6_ARAVE|nr:hypothetical protein AVEN_157098-1 [Araneus ventricosus]
MKENADMMETDFLFVAPCYVCPKEVLKKIDSDLVLAHEEKTYLRNLLLKEIREKYSEPSKYDSWISSSSNETRNINKRGGMTIHESESSSEEFESEKEFLIRFITDQSSNVHKKEFVNQIREEFVKRQFHEAKPPKIFSSEKVLNELDRIFGLEKAKKFMNDIRQFSEPILKRIMNLCHGIPISDDPEFAEEYTAVRSNLVMMVLPLLVYEKLIVFNTVPKEMTHPCTLVINSVPEFNIIVKDEIFCTAPNLETGAVCLLGLYMFLSADFPEKMKKIHKIVQNLFFQICYLPGNTPEPFCEQIRKSMSKENAGSP